MQVWLKYGLQVVFAGVSALGYGVLINVPVKALSISAFTGALGWAVYLMVVYFFGNKISASFFAAVCVAISAGMWSRRQKTPVIVYLVPGIIPLVPGANAYYAMQGFLRDDYSLGIQNLVQTMFLAGAIAIGSIAGSMLFGNIRHRK
jgi:uncharacterized membrane protein YjjB (DUF3815 family)